MRPGMVKARLTVDVATPASRATSAIEGPAARSSDVLVIAESSSSLFSPEFSQGVKHLPLPIQWAK
jgi:hypothetical protein